MRWMATSREITFRLTNLMWNGVIDGRVARRSNKKKRAAFGLRAVQRLLSLAAGGHRQGLRRLFGLAYIHLVRLVDSEQHDRQRS